MSAVRVQRISKIRRLSGEDRSCSPLSLQILAKSEFNQWKEGLAERDVNQMQARKTESL